MIYSCITNGCFRTDAVNCLVYEKLSLCAVILSGMTLDYFNIGKRMAVFVFQLCEALSCSIPKMLYGFYEKPKLICDFLSSVNSVTS